MTTRPSSPLRNFAPASPGLVIVIVGAVLVFWVFDALPFMDLPAHAGLMAIRHRFAQSPFEQHFYVFAPHLGPYSVFAGVGELLTGLIGPLRAVRAMATLPIVALPAAILFARWRLHGERFPLFGHIGVILSFGLMTLLGFASFTFGIAWMIVGLTLWLELMIEADRGAPLLRRKTFVLAAFAPLVFFAHGYALVLFLAMAGISTLAAGSWKKRLPHVLALGPALGVAAYSASLDHGLPAGSVPTRSSPVTLNFQGVLDKLSLLLTPTLTTRSGIDVLIGLVLWALLGFAIVATVRVFLLGPKGEPPKCDPPVIDAEATRAHIRALVACAVVLGIAFLALPHEIGWFGFVDGRLVPIVLLLFVMAIRREALGPRLRVAFDRLPPLLSASTVVLAWTASYWFQAEARGYREVLAAVPAYTRLLNFPIEPDSAIFTGHPFVHYDKLVVVERPVFVSDVWYHQGSSLFPRAGNPALALPPTYKSSTVRSIGWTDYRLEDWDYVLIRVKPDAPAPSTPPALSPVIHSGGWWLYKSDVATPAFAAGAR